MSHAAKYPRQKVRLPYPRSKSGCLVCRLQRKKCDERRPTCSRCSLKGKHCQWPDSSIRQDSDPESDRPHSFHDVSTPPTQDSPVDANPSEEDIRFSPTSTGLHSVAPQSFSLDPVSSTFMAYFVAETSRYLTTVDAQKNPFLTHVLPLAFSDELILHSLLALGGAHLLEHIISWKSSESLDWLRALLKSTFQEVGVTFVGAWGSVMYAGHLYNAVRQEKLLNTRWDDMELLFALHENFFVGDRPQTPEAYLKRFVLSLGASASTFAKKKRTAQIEESKRGPVGLKELAPVARMFHQRYCQMGARTDLAPQDFKTIVSKGMWEENEEESAEMSAADSQDLRAFARSEQPSKEQRHRSRRFTTPQLLQALRNSLGAEALEFSDYLKMHKICWTLLRAVQQQCHPRLKDMFGPMYIEQEYQLPYVVSYVFMAATDTDRINMAIAKKKEKVVTSALLVEAAGALDEHIRDGIGAAVSGEMGFSYEIHVH